MESLTKAEIFVFSLDSAFHQSLRDGHGHLLDAIEGQTSLRRANDTPEAMRLFDENCVPTGILITDAEIIAPRNEALSRRLGDYVRNGGTLLLGGFFSSGVRPNDLGRYMREKWNLPWAAGSYHRTTLYT